MEISALLVSTATRWLGTARAPKALAGAGFRVALLTPRNSLAEKSRYVAQVGYLPDNASIPQWIFAFAAMVKATAPRIVLPCDDMAFRLLQMLVVSPPPNLQPAIRQSLSDLVKASLGDPAHYRTSVDKTLLPPLAHALGIPVPPFQVVSALPEAEAFAARHGYPVVLKRSHGFAAQGVAICESAQALARAFDELSRPTSLDLEVISAPRFLVQAHVRGRGCYHSIAAWNGQMLAGWAAEKLVAHPEPTGPATVARYFHHPEIRAHVETLVRHLGVSGLCGTEWILEEGSREPYLLEINRRITPGTHRGALIRVDLCAALHAALLGQPSPSRSRLDAGEEGVNVSFPQEWLRDPESRWLREHPVEVPWDEPELIEAYLAMRHEA